MSMPVITLCLSDTMAKKFGEVRLIGRGQPIRWIVDRVVSRIPRIVKHAALECPLIRVSRDDVQVHVSVLILEERVVEVIRAKCLRQSIGGISQEPVQFKPLVFAEVGRLLHMPAGGEEALAQQILVVIEDESPMCAVNDDGTEPRVAEGTFH